MNKDSYKKNSYKFCLELIIPTAAVAVVKNKPKNILAANTTEAKLGNHFQRTRLVTPCVPMFYGKLSSWIEKNFMSLC